MKKFISKIQLIKLIIVVVFVGTATIFAFNDAALYKAPIAKITHIETTQIKAKQGSPDERFRQKMTLKLKNTKQAGTKYQYENIYTTSQYRTTKYHKGQYVFIKTGLSKKDGGYGAHGLKIMSQKYDYIWAFMLSLLVSMTVMIAGRRSLLILSSLALNIVVFALGMQRMVKFQNLEMLTLVMTALFIVGTLLLLFGLSRKSLGAILSSASTVLIVLGIYMLIIHFSGRLGYEYIDYTNGNEPLEALYVSSLVFSILGAVMDVSITIHSSVEEIVRNAPGLGVREVIRSIKGISNDIMGTMINVLFFTFVGDEIPINILKMANGYNMVTLFANGAVFEVIRFLIGAIGIALAVVVSGFFAVILRRKQIGGLR